MKQKLSGCILGIANAVPEIISFFYSFVWGLLLVLPMNTFEDSPSATAYTGMANVTNEYTWGLTIIVLSLTQLFSLDNKRTRYVRLFGHLLSSGVWFYIAIMFVAEGAFSLGVFSLIQVILASFLYWKVGVTKR